MKEYRLISSDSHVTMPDAAWQEYLEPHLREKAPWIEHADDGDYRIFEGQRSPILASQNLAGKRPEEFSKTLRRLDEGRSGAWDPAERIKDMDIDGIDAEVLYAGGPLQTKDTELRLASIRGYNRWLSNYASHAPGRLLGVAAVPIDTPELAAEEIQWAAQQPGLASGYIPLFPPDGNYGEDQWNVMWEAFLDAGWPVSLHVGGRRTGAVSEGGLSGSGSYSSALLRLTGIMMSKFTMPEALSELIHGLVMQRYPNLTFVSVEAQLGWISFFKYYADHLWEKHRYVMESKLDEPPSHFFDRQVLATFMEDPVGLRERHEIGIDNIMWASDYPHMDTTWPNSKSLTDEWFSAFGDEDKAKISWKNCATLYNLL